jgi:MFS family permease
VNARLDCPVPIHAGRNPESSTFFLLLFIAFSRIISNNLVTYVAGLIARVSGASDSEMGLINGIFVLIYACAAVFLGSRSDKWGRKRMLLLSYVAAAGTGFIYLSLLPLAEALPRSTVLTLVFLLRAIDGWFLGAFWPPLQGRLCESPGWNDRRLRFYNLSWSLGILLSNTLLSAATVVDPVPTILYPVLAILLLISEGILGVNVALLLAKIEDIPQQHPEESTNNGAQKSPITLENTIKYHNGPSQNTKIAIIAMIGYGLLMAAIYTNNFNQFSQISLATGGMVNLIPWVTILDNIRFFTQLLIFGIAMTPARPKPRFLVLLGLSTLLLFGAAIASEFLLQAGLFYFIPLVAIAGLVLGFFYANGFGVIMKEARPDNRGYYQGLLETISNLGYFVGIILSASISGVLGYFTSYAIVALCVLALFVLILIRPIPQVAKKTA